MNPRIHAVNTSHFRKIQKSYPKTTNEQHKQWLQKVWIKWARLKMKMIKRTQTGVRRTNGKNNIGEAMKEETASANFED